MNNNNKVNLFLVGVAKCGTTSLHDYLNQSHYIEMSSVKEPNYFSHNHLQKHQLYYTKNDIKSLSDYYNLFSGFDCMYSGESSVSYSAYNGVAQDLFDYNPKAKIIICLRNPVDRAYSHWRMDYNSGYFDTPWERIVDSPEIVDEKIVHQTIGLSFYSARVQEYIDTFGRDRIKVVFLEEMKHDPEGVMRDIELFLEIPGDTQYTFNVKHSALEAPSYLRGLYRNVRLKSFIRPLLPTGLIRRMKKTLLQKPAFTLSQKQREKLQKIFDEDVQRLQVMLEKDLNRIWKMS